MDSKKYIKYGCQICGKILTLSKLSQVPTCHNLKMEPFYYCEEVNFGKSKP